MKKIVLLLLSVAMFAGVSAQEKGKIRVGLDGGIDIPNAGVGLGGGLDIRYNIKDNIKKYYDLNFSIEDVGETYEPAYDKSRALLPISLFYSNSEKLEFIYSKIKKEMDGKSHQELKREIYKFVLAISTYERFGIDSIAGIYIKETINYRFFMVYNLEKRLGL